MKKEKILIIRSASLQQLDKNLPEIKQKFPDTELHLLTHPHNIQHCKKYKDIKKIISYDTKSAYSWKYRPEYLKNNKYKAVVVLATNISGTGFLNVQLLALRIKTEKIYICNLLSEVSEIRKPEIIGLLLRDIILFPFVLIISLPLSVAALFLMFFTFIFRKKT